MLKVKEEEGNERVVRATQPTLMLLVHTVQWYLHCQCSKQQGNVLHSALLMAICCVDTSAINSRSWTIAQGPVGISKGCQSNVYLSHFLPMALTQVFAVTLQMLSWGLAVQWKRWVHPEIIHEGRERKSDQIQPQSSDWTPDLVQDDLSKTGCHSCIMCKAK